MRYSRRGFLSSMAAAAKRPPNFLVLLTDDQRFDTIRALGNREINTPNLDRLVRRGFTFTHACSQGGLVPAVCIPSRAQILTGASVFGVQRPILDRPGAPDPALKTFPERLRESGYETFATGKWHNGATLFQRSFSRGAAIFFGGMADHRNTPVFDYSPAGQYPPAAARPAAGFSSEVFAGAAARFLAERDGSRPFLCYAAFTSPHDPRMAPPEFAAAYPPARVSLPRNFLPQHPFDNGEMKVRDELLAAFPRSEDEVRRHLAAYYAMISEVDHNIGRVLDALEATGAADRTYIIFAADNGLAVGRHGLMGKQNLYDHSLRVPLVICGPGIRPGARSHTLCHLMDLAPTLCDLAGLPPLAGLDGRSL